MDNHLNRYITKVILHAISIFVRSELKSDLMYSPLT
uniref:Uncharacterized protein n=1 Tax=Lepeophtheirus salmonis TaxID=72036 RepID=A0A0K2UZ13_LEPSM